MFHVTVDSAAVEKTLNAMSAQITALPDKMADEVTEWQSADMHRQRPNTERPDAHTVETDVWPRGREFTRTTSARRRGRPRGSRNRSSAVIAAAKAMRALRARVSQAKPILRPVLLQKLADRMDQLLGTISWA